MATLKKIEADLRRKRKECVEIFGTFFYIMERAGMTTEEALMLDNALSHLEVPMGSRFKDGSEMTEIMGPILNLYALAPMGRIENMFEIVKHSMTNAVYTEERKKILLGLIKATGKKLLKEGIV